MKLFLQNLAQTLVTFGPLGIFLLTLIDSSGIPLPGVADALLVGLAASNPSRAPLFAALAIVGSVIAVAAVGTTHVLAAGFEWNELPMMLGL